MFYIYIYIYIYMLWTFHVRFTHSRIWLWYIIPRGHLFISRLKSIVCPTILPINEVRIVGFIQFLRILLCEMQTALTRSLYAFPTMISITPSASPRWKKCVNWKEDYVEKSTWFDPIQGEYLGQLMKIFSRNLVQLQFWYILFYKS